MEHSLTPINLGYENPADPAQASPHVCKSKGLPLPPPPLLQVCWRRCAAALAPGPSWDTLSSRQRAWLLTTATLKDLLISPITLPSMPSPGSRP